MKAPYIYKMKVEFATRISGERMDEAVRNTETALPGYRKFLRKIVRDADSLSIRVCTPLNDGKGVMSILLSLAAEYIRLQYGSEVEPSYWVIDPEKEPDPGESAFASFTGRMLPEIGLVRRKKATRDNIGLIDLPAGMTPFVKSIVCG